MKGTLNTSKCYWYPIETRLAPLHSWDLQLCNGTSHVIIELVSVTLYISFIWKGTMWCVIFELSDLSGVNGHLFRVRSSYCMSWFEMSNGCHKTSTTVKLLHVISWTVCLSQARLRDVYRLPGFIDWNYRKATEMAPIPARMFPTVATWQRNLTMGHKYKVCTYGWFRRPLITSIPSICYDSLSWLKSAWVTQAHSAVYIETP